MEEMHYHVRVLVRVIWAIVVLILGMLLHALSPLHNCDCSHGRDNKLHAWSRIEDQPPSAAIRIGGSATLPGVTNPTLLYSMDVNALNYCRFSLLPLPLSTPQDSQQAEDEHALIALPNLVESSLVRF
jgi:hypothetical protein